MKKETWVELLVGTVILGTLAFLGVRIVDMSQLLGTVDGKLSLTSERVDRIAQALPDVGVRVAYEEVRIPIKTIVPATVSIIDINESKVWTLPVKLASREDKRTIGALAWTGAEIDPQYASVAQMQEYAQIAKSDTPIPSFINASTSFVLRSVSGEEFLEQAAWLEAPPTQRVVRLNGDNWELLAKSLKEREKQLAPTERSQGGAATEELVHCYGVGVKENPCKRENDCKTASNACKGQGACEAPLGFSVMSRADCEAKGGSEGE